MEVKNERAGSIRRVESRFDHSGLKRGDRGWSGDWSSFEPE